MRREARPLPLDSLERRPSGFPRSRLLGLAAALAAAAVALPSWTSPPVPAHAARPTGAVAAPAMPPPPTVNRFLPAPVRVLPPVVATTTGPHTFIQLLADGRPVTYDPCRAIHYVVNPDEAPAGWRTFVAQAISSVSDATGLEFVDDGEVTTPPTTDDTITSTPAGWPPLLIVWRTAQQYPSLAGDVAGESGSWPSADPATDATAHWVTGQVVLDADAFRQLAAEGMRTAERAITMHELGHVVGLDHVQDRHELMNPRYVGQRGWGPGDLEGLAALGAGTCERG